MGKIKEFDVVLASSRYIGGESVRSLSVFFGVSESTMRKRLAGSGLKMRTLGESTRLSFLNGREPPRYWLGKKHPRDAVAKRAAKLTGKGNGRWVDGSQSRMYRKKITKVKCGKCAVNTRLVIHHVNGDHYDNRESNLQVLCESCHNRLHVTMRWRRAKGLVIDTITSNAPVNWDR